MKLNNGYEYYCGCNVEIQKVIYSAMKDYNKKRPNRTVFVMCDRSIELNTIETVFRLSGAEQIICLYDTLPYRCHGQYFINKNAENNYGRRLKRKNVFSSFREDKEYEKILEKSKQILFVLFVVKRIGKTFDIFQCRHNFGVMIEKLKQQRMI